MTRMVRTLTALLLLGAATAAQAQGSRIYEAPDRWFTVSRGVVAYSIFYPNAADGTRSYGAEGATEAIMNRVKTVAPPALFRLGQSLDVGDRCTENQTQNASKMVGWAYACSFAIRKSEALGATAPPPALTPPPVQVASSAPPKVNTPAAPAAAPAGTAAVTAIISSTPAAVSPAKSDAQDGATAALNAKVKAELDAADARDRKKATDFELAQQKFEADKKASAAAYAKQMADHDAQVKALEAGHDAEMAAWRARVAACTAGDTTQCAAATP